jgi:chaperonin GroEL (HSP60 family)
LIDFRKAGIIDPVKVVKNSMIYASGVAGLVATATDVAIVNERI